MVAQFGLNPFEIRAGQKRQSEAVAAVESRLNPFEIRAGQKPIQPATRSLWAVLIPLKSGQARNVTAMCVVAVTRLNPFEIRAGQKLLNGMQLTAAFLRLNPFEIRAGQKLPDKPCAPPSVWS